MYEMYEDDTTDAEGGLAGNTEDDEEPVIATALYRKVHIIEVDENYVNYSVMLPRGNSYARGKVIRRKRYADGNAVGRTNNNPILDTHKYRVKFDDGEVSKITVNVITESIYAVYDDSGNEYLMME